MSEPMEFEVRPVRAEEHPAVLALSPRLTIGAAPWRDPARFAAAARGWIETSLAAAEDAGHAVFVAVRGGRAAGMVSLATREHFTGDRDAYVGELVTDAAAEGRGAGRALMAAAQQWAAQRGLYRITLETGAANERARHFYATLGYEEEEIRLSKAVNPAGLTGRERRA